MYQFSSFSSYLSNKGSVFKTVLTHEYVLEEFNCMFLSGCMYILQRNIRKYLFHEMLSCFRKYGDRIRMTLDLRKYFLFSHFQNLENTGYFFIF